MGADGKLLFSGLVETEWRISYKCFRRVLLKKARHKLKPADFCAERLCFAGSDVGYLQAILMVVNRE